MSNLVLVSPMKGWIGPLDEVPDPVFAERLLGDGVAVDPTGNTVYAPCDGMIMTSAKHAVTLRATCGAEILIHVGLETVALAGEGFVAHVSEGRSVHTGDPLLTFDLDLLARKVKSLISPVVVTNGDDFEIVHRAANRETEVGEFLMELKPLKVQAADVGDAGSVETRDVVVALAHGIHARPAATLANSAKRFSCDIALVLEGRRVNAKSIVALMSLGVRSGARVTVSATGTDARKAVDALADLIVAGLGEVPGEESAVVAAPAPVVQESGDPKRIRGVSAAPGIAIGPVAHMKLAEIAVAENGSGIAREAAEIARALAGVRARLELSAGSGDRHRRDILAAHIALLDDPELVDTARCAIAEGKSAGFAWRHAVRNYVHALEGLKDARLKERVQDLLDLERQVLVELNGASGEASFDIPRGAILIARELLPSQLLAVAERGIAGFCTVGGGPTAHVAILAAGMNIPALVSAGERVLDIPEGTQVVLDADGGELRLETNASELHELRGRMELRRNEASAAQRRAREDCRTADGVRIEVFANLGAGADEAAQAVAQGAEGCGLLRTEFLFQDRPTPPSEDEQAAQYQAIADALGGRPFIIRTFDIGGDKPVAYLALPPEENPALGLRGVRAALWRPDLLRTQLAAILRVKPAGQCRIMVPMVSSVSELRAVRAMLGEIANERGAESQIALGVMVETPASAMTTDLFAEDADFFSIGTNDLTQYVLAMDRGNARLASQIDALHPAVLRLIAQTARGAKGKMVAVCGGLAADRLAAPLLIGLGVTELSAPAAAIPGLKQTIREWRMSDCRALAEKALQCDAADDVRALLAAPAKTLAPAQL